MGCPSCVAVIVEYRNRGLAATATVLCKSSIDRWVGLLNCSDVIGGGPFRSSKYDDMSKNKVLETVPKKQLILFVIGKIRKIISVNLVLPRPATIWVSRNEAGLPAKG